MNLYKTRLINSSVRPDEFTDGTGLVYYNGKFHCLSGWKMSTNSTTTDHRTSVDGTDSPWPLLLSMPWHGHTFGYGVGTHGGVEKIIVVAPESHLQSSFTYDPTNGWVEHAWTGTKPDARYHYASFIHNGYIYICGGHTFTAEPVTYYNDLWKTPLNDLQAWTKVCDLPTDMQDLRSCVAVSFKGKIYWWGGARPTFDESGAIIGTSYMNTKMMRSDDNGATFTEVLDDEVLNSFWWGNAIATPDEIIAISGSDPINSLYYNNRIIQFDENLNIKLLAKNLPGRHATGICQSGNDIYFLMGFGHNDFWKLKKLA